jgi:hypothetical protein
MLEAWRNAQYGNNHLIAVWHGQRAARAKIILHIDDQQGIV